MVVVGSPHTGKTSIVNRFLNDRFEERYIPTIENFHRKLYEGRGETHQLKILQAIILFLHPEKFLMFQVLVQNLKCFIENFEREVLSVIHG
ncbi:unnamed protein product [Dracunculus medinensis]|uniref:G domain-containing protein n=1 Tax=Dracunculus medinensis TaxID=318479 RepID=A0A3P7Q2U9_DRAME|nr:unnamed protein product [Dracunculus medinensis]